MPISIRVLILEDQPEDAELMAYELIQAGFEPSWKRVDTEEEFIAYLSPPPDIILADYTLPQFNGLRALEIKQERGLDIPFILVTGAIGEEAAAEAIKRGAADYLLKDRLARLGASVTHALEQKRLRDDQRQARAELAASEQRFRRLAESTAAAIFILQGMNIRYANSAATYITGYSTGDLVKMKFWDLAHPNYVEALQRRGGLDPWVDGVPARFEQLIITRDGRQRWLDVTAGVTEFEGSPATVATAFDITDRVVAEEQLVQAREQAEESSRRYQELFEFAPDGYLVTDMQGIIQAANRAAATLTRVVQDALIGRSLDDLVARVDQYDLANLMSRLRQGDQVRGWEALIQRQGDLPFPAAVAVAPVRNNEGALVGLRWLVRNITERKQAEMALRQARDELEVRVQQRTAELVDANNSLRAEIAARERVEAEREKLMAQLEAERSRWEATVGSMIDPVTVCDAQGRAIYMNAAYSALVGRHIDETVNLPDQPVFYQLFHTDGTLFITEELPLQRAAIEGVEVRNIEIVQRTAEGSERTAIWNAAPVRDAQGNVLGAVAVGRDVTAQRRAEMEREWLLVEARRRAQEAEEGRRTLEALMQHIPEGITIADAPDATIRMISRYGLVLAGRPAETLQNVGMADQIARWHFRRADGSLPASPEELPLCRAVLTGEIVTDEEWAIIRPDGEQVPILCNAGPIRDAQGRITGGVIAWRDIRQRKQMEDELRQARDKLEQRVAERTAELLQAHQMMELRVQERTRELSTLLAISHNVASTLQLGPLLGVILDQLQCMLEYTGVTIYLLEDGHLTVREYRGPLPREEALQMRFPVQSSAGCQQVIASCQPLIIDDLESDSPEAQAWREQAADAQKRLLTGSRSWMGVPLLVKEQAIGMLRVDHAEPGRFTARHAQLAMAIANNAAVAIENARLYESAQQLAAIEERQRLARELHDSVSQVLYGIGLGAHSMRIMMDQDRTKATQALDYILSLADAGLAEMRALIFELRPESLETEGLVTALTKQALALHYRREIEVRTELGEEPSLPIPAKEALYRIAMEAINNAAKHAQPDWIELRLIPSATGVELNIIDNGKGFDPGGSFPGHLGLRSMRERAERVGAKLDIISAPGSGTQVQIHIPI